MKFVVLYSKKDEAGKNISRELAKISDIKIIEMQKESIFEEGIDKKPELKDADFLIFATKHASKAQVASLSVHAPGNWKSADFGGQVGRVCPTSALFLKHIFKLLSKYSEGNNITMEVTHHGPLIEKPCLFIEIGSSSAEWKNPELGKIIAQVIKEAISITPDSAIPAIAIGGPHYCPNFNKIQLSSESAISHVIPQYALPLTEEMLKEALSKTKEQVKVIILDWKGLKSEDRKTITDLAPKFKLKVIKTSEIK